MCDNIKLLSTHGIPYVGTPLALIVVEEPPEMKLIFTEAFVFWIHQQEGVAIPMSGIRYVYDKHTLDFLASNDNIPAHDLALDEASKWAKGTIQSGILAVYRDQPQLGHFPSFELVDTKLWQLLAVWSHNLARPDIQKIHRLTKSGTLADLLAMAQRMPSVTTEELREDDAAE